jgi:hypothetical protein
MWPTDAAAERIPDNASPIKINIRGGRVPLSDSSLVYEEWFNFAIN